MLIAQSSVNEAIARMRAAVELLWQYLREVSGENDYARHRAQALERKEPPMTPRAFYLWRLKQKYSRINRCC